MRVSLRFQTNPDFTHLLCTWLEGREVGLCFRGSGWNHGHAALAAFDFKERFSGNLTEAVHFCEEASDWVFCHLSYEVKGLLEQLGAPETDLFGFPLFDFFVPKVVIEIDDNEAVFWFHEHITSADEIAAFYGSICQVEEAAFTPMSSNSTPLISEAEYFDDLERLRQHLQRGDVYQANYCQAFFWKEAALNPSATFKRGFDQMPNPFSVFYTSNDFAVLCFSPERFIQVQGSTISSQPMKGTAPRGNNEAEDEAFRLQLINSEKDRRENVMIVDLVRNDLSHFAKPGSVKVPELYAVKAYPKVYQMHSTVVAELEDAVHPLKALLKAFPMGSMTGAPKIRAMQILEELEHGQRGIYSGSIGYFDPSGGADFNVVIRTLVYQRKQKFLSCHAGGGITVLSDFKQEYEEAMLKVKPLMELLTDQ